MTNTKKLLPLWLLQTPRIDRNPLSSEPLHQVAPELKVEEGQEVAEAPHQRKTSRDKPKMQREEVALMPKQEDIKRNQAAYRRIKNSALYLYLCIYLLFFRKLDDNKTTIFF